MKFDPRVPWASLMGILYSRTGLELTGFVKRGLVQRGFAGFVKLQN